MGARGWAALCTTLLAAASLNSCTKLDDATAPSCAYSVAPTSAAYGTGGGNGTVKVNAAGVCGWSATTNASWITINGEKGGTGDGEVVYGVASNVGTSERSGAIAIAGQSVTISQSAQACAFAVDPLSVSLDAGGGSGAINVTTAESCQWTAVSHAGWISLTGTTGRGSGSVRYSAGANGATAERAGAVEVAGRTVSVTQAGSTPTPPPAPQPPPPTPGCTYSVAPTSESFGEDGGSGSVNVTTGATCAWSAVSGNSWIAVTSGGGSGSGVARYSVASNGGGARTGALTVAGETVSVSQAARQVAPACQYAISPTSASIPAGGGAGVVSVTATTGCAWTTVGGASWITVANASGAGNGAVNFSVGANTSTASRSATLVVAERAFTITQAGAAPPPPPPPPCSYSISPTSASFKEEGGAGSISVSTSSACAWTATSNASWIAIISGASGTGNGTVRYTVSGNGGDKRRGTITVAGETFTVNQDNR